MQEERFTQLIQWAKGKKLPLDPQTEVQVLKLLSPESLSTIDELKNLFKPKPTYLGPGIWIRAIDASESSARKKGGRYE